MKHIIITLLLTLSLFSFETKLHLNGEIALEYNIVNGRLDGVSKRFNDKGEIILKETFKNGLLDGPSVRYFKNGSYVSVSFINGLAEGIMELRNKDGVILYYKNFVSGNLDGISKSFNEDGSLLSTSTYQNGILLTSFSFNKYNRKIFATKKDIFTYNTSVFEKGVPTVNDDKDSLKLISEFDVLIKTPQPTQ